MEGIKALMVNSQHIKAVQGKKTDVKDAEWIADLLRHGLLKGSFIPSRDQRELGEWLWCIYCELIQIGNLVYYFMLPIRVKH